MNLELTTLTF